MGNVFIIGGPGNISHGTLDYLLERNHDITVFTRNVEKKRLSWPDIRFSEGDRGDPDALEKAFENSRADIVMDTVCFELSDAVSLHGITKDRIRQLLFISTVDAYGYPLSRLPFREQDAFKPAVGAYAQKKRSIELFYRERMEMEGYPVTIGRPSLSISPDFCPMMFHDWGLQAVSRMRAGKPLLVPGDGNGLMHVGWGYDVGRMAGRILGDENAVGREYTLSAEDCITRDDYISLFTDYLDVGPERVYIPQALIERFDGVADIPRIPHLYRINMAFSLENFKKDFPDYEWLPLGKGVAEFIEVNTARGTIPSAEADALEDRIISEWKRRLAGW
jgi:nucleoside-diphosphate-sugar epimerase